MSVETPQLPIGGARLTPSEQELVAGVRKLLENLRGRVGAIPEHFGITGACRELERIVASCEEDERERASADDLRARLTLVERLAAARQRQLDQARAERIRLCEIVEAMQAEISRRDELDRRRRLMESEIARDPQFFVVTRRAG